MFFIVVLFFLDVSIIHADALNQPQGMSASSQAKVSKAIAKSYANNNQHNMRRRKGATCSPQIGVTKINGKGRVPREITTVVTGDVISVCR